MDNYMELKLRALDETGNLRRLPRIAHEGKYVTDEGGRRMLNLSSNDYLGLGADKELRRSFLEGLTADNFLPTASSSRLLTGNFRVFGQLEDELAALYGTEAALTFGSGYHANTGILPAVADKQTLILADKLVHASLIDGIRLSTAHCIRYRHNDMEQLERLLRTEGSRYVRTIIVTESIFSMDGDEADLPTLVRLKRQYPQTMLYLDEAHAFGVRGPRGLGCAEEQGCLRDVDFLVGTFGKAAASAGAFVACTHTVRQYLVNRMRTFIFTTAQPPVCAAWTLHVLRHMVRQDSLRSHLARLADRLRHTLAQCGHACPGSSHIVPLIVGSSKATEALARQLQQCGFYALPVRPPTVPEGTSRIRFSLTADMREDELPTADTLYYIPSDTDI